MCCFSTCVLPACPGVCVCVGLVCVCVCVIAGVSCGCLVVCLGCLPGLCLRVALWLFVGLFVLCVYLCVFPRWLFEC